MSTGGKLPFLGPGSRNAHFSEIIHWALACAQHLACLRDTRCSSSQGSGFVEAKVTGRAQNREDGYKQRRQVRLDRVSGAVTLQIASKMENIEDVEEATKG